MWNCAPSCVIIEITGLSAERLINRMRGADVPVWEIRRHDPRSIRLTMRAEDFFRLRPLVRGTALRVHILRRTGLPFRLMRVLQRKTLLAVSMLLVALLAFLSTRILLIEVSGCKRVSEQTVLRALSGQGLFVGAKNSGYDLPTLNNVLRTYDDRIAWIGLEVSGVVLRAKVVEATERIHPQNTDVPADVVAQKDGIVSRITARSGRAAIKVGDSVQAGDVLIRGDLTTETSQYPVTVHAYGEVFAYVGYLSQAAALPAGTALADSGRSVPYRAVFVCGRLLFESRVPYAQYELRNEERAALTGAVLPMTVLTADCFERVETEVVRTTAEMAEEALFLAEQSAYLKVPRDAAIVEKQSAWQEQDGCVLASVYIVTEESIGMTRELNVDGNG